MHPLRIAFGCQARVGKDTACEYLKEKYGGVIYHFSDPLYDIQHYAQDVCGFPRQKDVKFLQWIGTEWARAQNITVWIDHTINKVPDDQNCFIGDVRFRNEADALKAAGFLCVRIVRKDRPIDRNAKHASEIDLDGYTGWDAIIENDGTIEELHTKVEALVQIYENRFKGQSSTIQ